MEKRSYNLCSTYILPMVGVNRFSFGQAVGMFKNSYVSEDNKYVVVELSRAISSILTSNAAFRFKFEKDGVHFAVFEIPSFFAEDIIKFREGKYSQFSTKAKDQVRKKSGLNYKVPIPGGGMRSARELLALDKDKELRKAMETELSNPHSPVCIAEDAELVSIPGADNFYKLNLSTELQEAP